MINRDIINWEAVYGYCRAVGNILKLQDWRIIVNCEKPEEEFLAISFCVEGQHKVILKFSDEFFTITSEEQKIVVIHELLHAHLDELGEILRVDLGDLKAMSKREYELLYGMHKRQAEYITETLANAFAPFIDNPQKFYDPIREV
jgi:hypothetical protein